MLAFILGIIQFRKDITPAFDCDNQLRNYDKGRDLAHKLTLRRFD